MKNFGNVDKQLIEYNINYYIMRLMCLINIQVKKYK